MPESLLRDAGRRGVKLLALWAGVVLSLVVGVGFAVTPLARAEALSPAELEKLPVMVEWVYRNSPVKDPLSCGEACSSLWTSEHGSMPNQPASQELWDQLGTFETSNGLWPSLYELKAVFGSYDELGLPSGPFVIGWRVKGTIDKWMSLAQMGEPYAPELRWCDSLGNYEEKLIPPVEPYGTEPEAGLPARPVTSGWTYIGGQQYCYYGGVGYYAEALVPAECNRSITPPPLWPGWTNITEAYTSCSGETNEVTALRTRPFHFGRPEDYGSQTATYVLENGELSSVPTREAIEAALKAALESSSYQTLRKWLRYLTTGEGGNPTAAPLPSEEYGPEAPGAPNHTYSCVGEPVNCATGNLIETQNDLSVGGRGVGLNLTRTYNSQAAATGATGIFGPGWTSSFSDHLVINGTAETATVYDANGSTVTFKGKAGTPGALAAPAWVQSSLVLNSDGTYLYTLPGQRTFHFDSTGRLLSEADRNANTTTLSYSTEGRLETVTDPASRKLTLKYNSEGLVESAEDPMKHVVKYTYEGGSLKSVTEPGEASARWQFKYDGSHQLTELIDGRAGKTLNEYDASHRVISQTDPLGHKLTFEYHTESEPLTTVITNHATSAVTKEFFNGAHELTSISRGYGSSAEVTESSTYDPAGDLTSHTDGNVHTTSYTYDTAGNRTSMVDPNGHEKKWKYDSTHDIETETTPEGETTTIKRNSKGDPEVIERPAPGSTTQKTTYKLAGNGDVESMTDPLEHEWKYEYDSYGDRKTETDPVGNKRTWEYNEDSQETATVSPRGHVKEGEESKFTTKVERDAQGRPLTITDPLGHKTKLTYDGDSNVETVTDPNSNKTKYTYDADNERTKTEEPNKTITETEYDSMGKVKSQTDGNKHTTKYERNLLEEVTEVIDPKEHKTTKEYDAAGNLTKLTDPAKRTTTFTYDPGNRLKEIGYSDGKTHAVEYEYNKDSRVKKMVDGSGTTKTTLDQLDRPTEVENGHKEVTKYEYNLANEPTKITYPNEKAVTRAYDKDGRLEKVTDWNSKITKFTYDPDSDLKAMVFPSETKNEDTYTYNDADRMSEVKMKKSTEVLASLLYSRDNDAQVKTVTSKGLPGEEKPAYEYDPNSRLKKGGTIAYEYDAASNPTKLGATTQTFSTADELEKAGTTSFSYAEAGERTKQTPETGAATTYGDDQAGNLASVERPEKESVPKIEDTYAYNGEGLRTSQTISGTTTYMAWDTTKELPLLLSDGTNSYIYGPGSIPVEQINNSTGTATYLHHDQQGSTRLLTGSTGTVTGKCTYGAYGTPTCEGTTTTPLGYDAQYTSSDTGLIYMRARTYDPATAQFLSADPAAAITRSPYFYTNDNPLNFGDPSGLSVLGTVESAGETLLHAGLDVAAVPPYAVYYGSHEIARGLNELGKQFGLPGEVIAHLESLPLAQLQALGLAGDVTIDALKNFILGHESICDEGKVGFINPLHGYLPGPLKGPATYLPGVHENGEIDFEW